MAGIDDPATRKAYQLYWGPVREGARQGWTTAQLWDVIKASAASLGMPTAAVGAAQISRLRGIAGSLERAARSLQALPRTAGIGADQIGVPPWNAGRAAQQLTPQYQVRALFTIEDQAGNEVQAYKSISLPGLPQTKQDLMDAIDLWIDNDLPDSPPGAQFVNLESFELLAL